MKGAAEGARLPASERSPAIVRLPFMFVMLSTISVNRRGPLSMPRAGTISRHIICSGQLFAQFFRGHPEELPEA
ncbi:MAG: hypothetical protein WBQ11_14935, partial [Isosphaeraceae bacterium]